MDFLNFFNRGNAEYIEELYDKYQENPESVDERWRLFFAGFEVGLGRPLPTTGTTGEFATLSQRRSDGTGDLVHSYRSLGHVVAELNPLGNHRPEHPLLNISEFGFSSTADLDRKVGAGGFLGPTDGTLRDLLDKLRQTYCGSIGVEYMDIPDKEQRNWIVERLEPNLNQPNLTADEKKRVLKLLLSAKEFEHFINTKYLGQKRFSVEGGESLIPTLDLLIEEGAKLGMEQAVLGMGHRGRLNVLVHILGKPYEMIFTEFEGTVPQEDSQGDGDVKYHKGYSRDRQTEEGHRIHVSLSPNPSHLELVDPVVEGYARARQQYLGDTNQTRVVPILIHGEAAFPGQGIVPETLNLSELEEYRTGGTVHIIVNNQLGFTATAQQTRFTPYPTDVAKMIHAPIFHVNGDDPEAVIHAARLAVGFRQAFKIDVMIDLWCYRRYGHNETDDPTFTQPLMYERIDKMVPISEKYAQKLVDDQTITAEELETMRNEIRGQLETSYTIAKEKNPFEKGFTFEGAWKGMTRAGTDWGADTKVSADVLQAISKVAATPPEGFSLHKKLKRLVEAREEMAQGKRPVDWGCAEMWGLGSLLLEGTSVRLTGQDSERGTFSHRHAVYHDTVTGEIHVPLQHLKPEQPHFTIVNTMLSELAVLGFEFGYSLADPQTLVLWEAQFGDFVNGAQPIIDQFISSSESKWQRMSGLVLLLPHGYEGQGPEHSSARLERFLQLSAENNIQVVYPSQPHQYFHLLRRQMKRSFRKPLVVMTPKSMLRDERAGSELSQFTEGSFNPFLDDTELTDRKKVRRLLICSGKVFHTLSSRRKELAVDDIAIARVEQLYPVPERELETAIKSYSKAVEWFWVQEEPKNMGPWNFIKDYLRPLLPAGSPLEYCGRDEAASPAVGSFRWHLREEEEILTKAFSGSPPKKS